MLKKTQDRLASEITSILTHPDIYALRSQVLPGFHCINSPHYYYYFFVLFICTASLTKANSSLSSIRAAAQFFFQAPIRKTLPSRVSLFSLSFFFFQVIEHVTS